ncbi:transposase [Duganella callida]|uniref:Transposase n=1 Tax=Duganella callida TaxID=2561932 RepID=A0A4Y9SJG7_9BURK|nr:transposase [Duganella callida]TFW21060.1 transposase [Duganella callida]
MNDDYDTPWKEVVTRYFPEFMAFYFNDAYAAIDWSRPYAFLDQELAALSHDAAQGRRLLDKLVRVHLRDGGEQWVLVHLEVQGRHDAGFAERIFTYHYRVYDRYRKPVASLAVLADSGRRWRPSSFAYELLGCEMCLMFPIVKLQDYADCIDELLLNHNPFALVTAAHLMTQQTRHDATRRRAFKWRLTRLLYRHHWDRQRILSLFRAIDWMMRLPEAMEQKFHADVLHLEEGGHAMPYVTSIERIGRQIGREEGRKEGREEGRTQGRQEGRAQGRLQGQAEMLLAVLADRYGALDAAARARVEAADEAQLHRWAHKVIHAASLREVFGD